jgi:hypothetical protein
MPKNKLFLLSLLIPLILVVSLELAGIFSSLDHKILLWQQKLSASSQDSNSPIVLVKTGKNFADEEKASFLDYVLFTQAIIPYVPSVVIYENYFSNLPKEDEAYVPQFIKRTHRLNQAILSAQIPPLTDSHLVSSETPRLATLPYSGDITQLSDYQYVLAPTQGVEEAGWLGIHFLPYSQKDPLEKVSLFFRVNDKIYPSLPFLAYCKFRRADLSHSKVYLGEEIILKNSQGYMLDRIPLDKNNLCWLLYHSKKPYSAETDISTIVLASEQSYQGEKSAFDLSTLRKKIIIVEKGNPLDSPKIKTPLGELSSTEIHAQILSALIYKYFLVTAPTWLKILFITFVGIFGFWTFLFLRKTEAFTLFAVNLFALFLITNCALKFLGIWIPLTSVYLSLILCSGLAALGKRSLK